MEAFAKSLSPSSSRRACETPSWLFITIMGAIYDTMQFMRPQVSTMCLVLAASMGSS